MPCRVAARYLKNRVLPLPGTEPGISFVAQPVVVALLTTKLIRLHLSNSTLWSGPSTLSPSRFECSSYGIDKLSETNAFFIIRCGTVSALI